jgi:hypothetical protein
MTFWLRENEGVAGSSLHLFDSHRQTHRQIGVFRIGGKSEDWLRHQKINGKSGFSSSDANSLKKARQAGHQQRACRSSFDVHLQRNLVFIHCRSLAVFVSHPDQCRHLTLLILTCPERNIALRWKGDCTGRASARHATIPPELFINI